ncbi:hypothetical protein EHQ46_14290 [Leptospira yanagawae]|uniref:Uncharacterized protein n=1 Tax=Leptospira yanagawae TaxID=293069 RepID=A0ABY2LZ25_9LEPT|nr:hypothetical protein [Leptospira yanagawae]TGL18975.1 hypothetical protein EHQ46_14290 [Leptospira yanagawae]
MLEKLSTALEINNMETLPYLVTIAKILNIQTYELKKLFKNKNILKKDLYLFTKKNLSQKHNRKLKLKSKNTVPLHNIIENDFVISNYLWIY